MTAFELARAFEDEMQAEMEGYGYKVIRGGTFDTFDLLMPYEGFALDCKFSETYDLTSCVSDAARHKHLIWAATNPIKLFYVNGMRLTEEAGLPVQYETRTTFGSRYWIVPLTSTLTLVRQQFPPSRIQLGF